jgi:hypothetical protein
MCAASSRRWNKFPDALVAGWETIAPTIQLPDPRDRHVVAAAFVGRADVIVTENSTDFPAENLPAPLFTQTVDTFLLDAIDLQPALVIEAVKIVAARSGRQGESRTPHDIVSMLGERGCPRFAEAIVPRLSAGAEG